MSGPVPLRRSNQTRSSLNRSRRRSGRRVRNHRGELNLAGDLALHAGLAPELAHTGALLDEADVEVEQAAGFHGRAELGLVDGHEIDQLARSGELQRLDGEDRRGLRQRLDLQYAGHDRTAGEMPLEELLVEADRLDRVNLLVDLQA